MATVRMPSSWAERSTRMAISPRLATSSLRISRINATSSGAEPGAGGPRGASPPAILPDSAPSWAGSGFGLDRILQPADPGDRGRQPVAGPQVRPAGRADARGRARGDQVARL